MVEQDARTQVLLVDDSTAVASALARQLARAGFRAEACSDARSALARLDRGDVWVVVSDISMPEMDGIQLLRSIRERHEDLPVVLMTGTPDVSSAAGAVDFGAFRYLTKPIEINDLIATVRRAAEAHQLAVAQRQALAAAAAQNADAVNRAQLGKCFDRSLSALWMAYQPIVSVDGALFGYEALLRSDETSLPHPGAILAAAERLDALPQLGRAVRQRVAHDVAGVDADWRVFVNLHPSDLVALDALEEHAGLQDLAPRVVLEITERAAIGSVEEAMSRVTALRRRGYSIAVDDLGAGYSGLSSVVHLEPDYVKLDISLVRDAHKIPLKERLLRSIIGACKDLGITVVAEGIESEGERDALVELGCDLLQGFHFGKPSKPFIEARW